MLYKSQLEGAQRANDVFRLPGATAVRLTTSGAVCGGRASDASFFAHLILRVRFELVGYEISLLLVETSFLFVNKSKASKDTCKMYDNRQHPLHEPDDVQLFCRCRKSGL